VVYSPTDVSGLYRYISYSMNLKSVYLLIIVTRRCILLLNLSFLNNG